MWLRGVRDVMAQRRRCCSEEMGMWWLRRSCCGSVRGLVAHYHAQGACGCSDDLTMGQSGFCYSERKG
jgi:hypothetical protein